MIGRTEASTTDYSVERIEEIDDVARLTGDPIVNEAQLFLDRCEEWYSEADRRFLEDLKFANGDSKNGYQWPNNIRHARDIDQRPALTINIVRQHNKQIINQALQSKSDITILGTGGGASAESASAFKWLVKHIEYQSNAQAAYKLALRYQVECGRGWWRIITDWAGSDTFDQEIFIRPVWDPLSVKPDPDARMPDLSDMRQCIVFDMVPRGEFFAAYPELRDIVGDQPLGTGSVGGDWIPKDEILVAEYFRKVIRPDRLISFVWRPEDGGDGQRRTVRESLVPPAVRGQLLDDSLSRVRDTWDDVVEWYLIAGSQLIDQTIWPGKYIPLIRAVGEECLVDGIYDAKGHTRYMEDAQRMYNYNASGQVEFGALQTKVPWIAPIEGIEDFRTVWETANLINHAYLPYKFNNEQFPDKPLPPPQRPDAPQPSPAYQAGMETAFNQMMMSSGQWQNQMGMQGNERTGEAINQRKQQGDTATFHFQDNFADSLRFTGVQLIDLIPKVYNTKRAKRIITEEGLEFDLLVDPSLQEAYMAEQNHQGEVIRRIFNPSVGQYDVAADVGPASGTRRQENVEAFTLILTQNPALTGIIGDLLLKNLDFEDAQEAARRLRRMVPPQALGQGPTQSEQALQQQLQQMQALLEKTMQRAGVDRLKADNREDTNAIATYKAETDRMAALQKMLPTDPSGLQEMIEQLVKDSLATHLLPAVADVMNGGGTTGSGGNESMDTSQATEAASAAAASAGVRPGGPPVPGSRQAPDGEWYLQDPTRSGKYLRVAPLAQERKPKGVVSNV